MATYTVRGTSHSVIYWYTGPEGRKQHWETYATELEAMQRKAFIDYLQKTKQEEQLYQAVLEYKQKRADEKATQEVTRGRLIPSPTVSANAGEDNTRKTYREFAEKWLPYHARKKRFSPNTFDCYTGNLRNHILPYFGDRVMSGITAEDIDNFMDHLSRKPCWGGKTYNADPENIPTLSSATVKKCYNILSAGFRVAKKWRYITEIPETTAPAEKWKKRKAWEPPQVLEFLAGIKDNKLLHLIVHIAFVCSLRAGEVAGIEAELIDFDDSSLWILQQVQRVSDAALEVIPKSEITRAFPKQNPAAQSSLILKAPKTEGSRRKQYHRRLSAMQDYIDKCPCFIHSLKQGEKNVLAEATIIKRLGDNDYLADYDGVKCHAIFNPFAGRYFVDDKYGVIRDSAERDSR